MYKLKGTGKCANYTWIVLKAMVMSLGSTANWMNYELCYLHWIRIIFPNLSLPLSWMHIAKAYRSRAWITYWNWNMYTLENVQINAEWSLDLPNHLSIWICATNVAADGGDWVQESLHRFQWPRQSGVLWWPLWPLLPLRYRQDT